MIELQGIWDVILASRREIDNAETIIKNHDRDLSDLKNKLAVVTAVIKELKSNIKQNELDLNEMDARIKKLDERKKIVHNEKELHAVDKEIDVIKFDIGTLEEKILVFMDELDVKNSSASEMTQDLQERESIFSTERDELIMEITRHRDMIKSHEEKFNIVLESLAPAYRSKFVKMLNSKEGRAIAQIYKEVCGSCNFQIPSFLVADAADQSRIFNCTNCGRYIYK